MYNDNSFPFELTFLQPVFLVNILYLFHLDHILVVFSKLIRLKTSIIRSHLVSTETLLLIESFY